MTSVLKTLRAELILRYIMHILNGGTSELQAVKSNALWSHWGGKLTKCRKNTRRHCFTCEIWFWGIQQLLPFFCFSCPYLSEKGAACIKSQNRKYLQNLINLIRYYISFAVLVSFYPNWMLKIDQYSVIHCIFRFFFFKYMNSVKQ